MPAPAKKRKRSSTDVSANSSTPLPSEAISSAHRSFKPAAFWKLLQQHVLPKLDELLSEDEAAVICSVFEPGSNASARDYKAKLVFDERKKKLTKMFKDLKKLDGWEEEGEAMAHIGGELESWVQDIFFVGIEEAAEFREVNKCLLYILQMVKKLQKFYSQSEFEDGDPEYKIKTSSGTVVYDDNKLERTLAKTWWDVLLTAIARGDEEEAVKILDSLKEAGTKYIMDLKEYVRTPKDGNCKENMGGRGWPFEDEWHSEILRGALPKLRRLLDINE